MRVALAATAAVAGLIVSATAAACPRWNVSGEWSLQQQNWISVRLQIEQRGTTISGRARYMQRGGLPEDVYPKESSRMRERHGTLEGTVDGGALSFTIRWTRMVGDDRQYVGRYESQMSRHGRAEGRTQLTSHPGDPPFNWYSSVRFPCDLAALEAADAPPVAGSVRTPSRSEAAATTTDGVAAAPSRAEAAAGVNAPTPGLADGSGSSPKRGPAAVELGGGYAGAATGGPASGAAPCRLGYVWREARPGDTVCVPPEARALARRENQAASARVNPSGAYGPNTCVAGFVWRGAFDDDVVCVVPERREQVRAENLAAASRALRR